MSFANAANWVENVANLFQPSRRESPKRQRQEVLGSAVPTPIDNPFTPEQTDWLEVSLSNSMRNFGQSVHKRFVQNETEIDICKGKLASIEQELAALRLSQHGLEQNTPKMQTDLDAVVTRIGEAERKLAEELCSPSELGAPSPSSSKRSGKNASTPYELRNEFTIGNLGWDEAGEIIVQRAKELLRLLNIDEKDYEGPVAVRATKGSLAEVWFHDPLKGTLARLRCKALRKIYHSNRIVWLDAKKTMEELKPGRVLRRAQQVMTIFEGEKEVKREITANLKDFTLAANGIIMLNARIAPPIFTKEGAASFNEDQRRQIVETFTS